MNPDQQRLFGACVLVASIGVLVWTLAGMSPLPTATLSEWPIVAALTASAAIGSLLCWRAAP